MLVVRRLRADELALVRPLSETELVTEEACVRISRTGFQLDYRPALKTQWRAFPAVDYADPAILVQDEGSAFYAAFEGEKYIGCAAVTTLPSGWADVIDLRVDPAHRLQGAGRMLMDKCEHFAMRRGLHGLRAASTDGNPLLCRFLEHMGFTLSGLDTMALSRSETERVKPVSKRATLLIFYRIIQKG